MARTLLFHTSIHKEENHIILNSSVATPSVRVSATYQL
jgi:hypothetical protein